MGSNRLEAFSDGVSFVNLGIYWNTHHHMLHLTRHATGGILWANMHLRFWLSVIGVVCLLAAIAYWILQTTIVRSQGPDSVLARAIGRDVKGTISPVAYALAIPAAFLHPGIAGALYAAVALP